MLCCPTSGTATLKPTMSLSRLSRVASPLPAGLRSLASRAQQRQESGSSSENVPVTQQKSDKPAKTRKSDQSSMMPAWPPASQTSLASVLPSMLLNPWAVMGGQGPFGLADKLLHDFEDELRMMERPGEEEGEMGRLWAAVDVKETPNEFVLSTDVPGLSKSDVHITLEDNNVLRMTGERKREDSKEGEGWKRMERSYGMFERRFKVPSNADASKIKAEMDHGVLRVHMPKMEEKTPQKVEISVGGSGPQGSLKEGEHKQEQSEHQKK